jgi:hypothetical protein
LTGPAQLVRQICKVSLGSLQLTQLALRDALERKFGGAAFERCPDDKRLAEFLPRDRAHAGTAISHQRDEADGGQLSQCLANRRSRHSELFRELLLPEHFARSDCA